MHALKGFLHRHDQRLQPRGTDAVASGVKNIFAYRKQRGVNLGAWFVLERWITNAPFQFAEGPGQSDLDIARGKDAKVILESHWDTWISEDDWDWLAERGINTVRIPVRVA
jgi:glucan 1,3-beta-glucosidase